MIKSYQFDDGSWEETENGSEKGPYKIFYKSGNLEEEGKYINKNKHGPYSMYYETGEIQQFGNYKSGELDGIYVAFHKNGNVKEFGRFSAGEIDGILEHYDIDERLKTQFYINKGTPSSKCTQYNNKNNTLSQHKVEIVDRITFKAGAAVSSDINPDTVFPDSLDHYIYDVAYGIYKIQGESYNQDTITVEEYLGTYFPRTFMESQSLFYELLKNNVIKSAFKKKKNLKILDIGTGPGAPFILGLTWALKRHGIFKILECDLIDRKQEHLDCAEQTLKLFVKEAKIIQFKHEFELTGSFKEEIESLVAKKFDIILTSKMCIEFYNRGITNAFSDLLAYYDSYLENDGIGVINEVTKPSDQNKLFMSKKLAEETNEYVKAPEADIDIIMPLSCAFRKHICGKGKECFQQNMIMFSTTRENNIHAKFCSRILAKKQFAKEVLDNLKQEEIYRTTFYDKPDKRHQYCTYINGKHASYRSLQPQPGSICYNPFKWNEINERG